MCSTCLFQQANKNCCGTVSRAYVFQLCGNSRLGPLQAVHEVGVQKPLQTTRCHISMQWN